MFNILKYSNDKEKEWDDFIYYKSVNGTFLQSRNFLNYHVPNKFLDASFMIYDSKGNLYALCLACEYLEKDKKALYSHKGTSFGGIIISEKYYKAKYVIEIIKAMEEYFINNKISEVHLKITPDIFSKAASDLLQYCLQYSGFSQFSELSTYIDFSQYDDDILKNFEQGKRTNVHNCIKEGLKCRILESESELKEFYSVLCENLQKYNTKPVHTIEELLEFKNNRLKEKCEFLGVFKENTILAGAMIFYFENSCCAHTQYLAARLEYNKLSPMTFMYYSIIDEMKRRGYKRVSWGISTERFGQVLNIGLITSKEAFGSLYSLNRTFYKKYI